MAPDHKPTTTGITNPHRRDVPTRGFDWRCRRAPEDLVSGPDARAPINVVLAALAQAMRETGKVHEIIGGTTADAAHRAAWEWLKSGIDPRAVIHHLRAGCTNPTKPHSNLALTNAARDIQRRSNRRLRR